MALFHLVERFACQIVCLHDQPVFVHDIFGLNGGYFSLCKCTVLKEFVPDLHILIDGSFAACVIVKTPVMIFFEYILDSGIYFPEGSEIPFIQFKIQTIFIRPKTEMNWPCA